MLNFVDDKADHSSESEAEDCHMDQADDDQDWIVSDRHESSTTAYTFVLHRVYSFRVKVINILSPVIDTCHKNIIQIIQYNFVNFIC